MTLPRITLDGTITVVDVSGVPARVWKGKTDDGQKVFALIALLVVDAGDSADAHQIDRALAPTPNTKFRELENLLRGVEAEQIAQLVRDDLIDFVFHVSDDGIACIRLIPKKP